jgi:DNA adenine methylase
MKAEKRVKPILRWPGGKSRLLKLLLPMIPEHVCSCEVFAGGAALTLAKERSKVEILNDINGDLVRLYLSAQKHLPELLRQIEMLVSSREMFHWFNQQQGITDIERAARFLLRNRISFGGNMHSFGVSKSKGGGVAFSRKSVGALLDDFHGRLDNVVIEHLPFERCLDNYDSKDTFFFMDPPYLKSKIEAYEGWNESQMRQFRKRVEKIQGKWIITLDDSPLNRQLFSDCQVQAVTSENRSVNRRTHFNKTFGELIITKA